MAKGITNQKVKALLTERGVSFVMKNHPEAVNRLKRKRVWHKFIKRG